MLKSDQIFMPNIHVGLNRNYKGFFYTAPNPGRGKFYISNLEAVLASPFTWGYEPDLETLLNPALPF